MNFYCILLHGVQQNEEKLNNSLKESVQNPIYSEIGIKLGKVPNNHGKYFSLFLFLKCEKMVWDLQGPKQQIRVNSV